MRPRGIQWQRRKRREDRTRCSDELKKLSRKSCIGKRRKQGGCDVHFWEEAVIIVIIIIMKIVCIVQSLD